MASREGVRRLHREARAVERRVERTSPTVTVRGVAWRITWPTAEILEEIAADWSCCRSWRHAPFALRRWLGDRHRAARHLGVQPLDHAAVDLMHALAVLSGSVERRDDLARPRHLLGRCGENTSLQGPIWSGWISVLPSKPRSRPCTHSARKPSSSARVVVDAVEDVEAVGARGGDGRPTARAASARGRARRRARVSLARSLVPITKPASRVPGCAPRRRSRATLRMASGVSIIAHSRVLSGAPALASASAGADDVRAGSDTFGTRMASGAAAAAASGRPRPTACRGR